jgi:Zn-dependent protease with chaperone function
MQASRTGPAVVLSLLTAALELPTILARYVAVYVVAVIASKAGGGSSADASEWAKLAVVPTLWSAVALISPAGGGWWWRQRLGGREPSTREYVAYRAAMDEIRERAAMPLPEPKHWFVLDESEPDAAVCGDALMLTRGLLQSPHLAAVLAHELGHLHGMDGRVAAALDRLILSGRAHARLTPAGGAQLPASASSASAPTPRRKVSLTRWVLRMALALLRGGLGLQVTSLAWGQIWREQEYEADRFAASIGWGEELAEFLQAHALRHDHPIPLVGLAEHVHPPAELRIDALRADTRGPDEVT